MELTAGARFPDLDLPDHTGRARRLSELAAGDPVALLTSRGWWCPKEQRYMRELSRVQDEFSARASPSSPTTSGVGFGSSDSKRGRTRCTSPTARRGSRSSRT
jgi:peroxiredoxin